MPRHRQGKQAGAFELAINKRAAAVELIDIGHKGKKQTQNAIGGSGEQGAHLVAQQGGPIERDAQGAPTECRILFSFPASVRQYLVAAQIERAEDDGLFSRRLDHLAIKANLVGKARHGLADHELKLGAKKPDSVGA